ncbi:MAG TPA: mismatch-specific DNA-glycosylase [Candidatus Babeliales bacterium]|nr:mismatch-specific DNA-glycosylase [Candidatus Babeliales bacterium]
MVRKSLIHKEAIINLYECYMIKYQVGYGLKILFIGVNPHPGSYRRGVPFSNNKMFWYLLSAAGLLDEPREFLKDDTNLKNFYLYKLKKVYHIGISNVVPRQTRSTTELKKEEAIPGRKRVLSEIIKYKPLVVCFVGKITYLLFSRLSKASYGWQDDIGTSKIYVMHPPHRGAAEVRIKELKEIDAAAQKINQT